MIRATLILVAALAVTAFLLPSPATGEGVNMPSTVIHHVTLKWKDGVSDADKQKVIDGLKALLAEVPGAKNLWIKSVKIQPKEHTQSFVIEFENEAALKAYADYPKKKEWNDFYYSVREESQNCVTTN